MKRLLNYTFVLRFKSYRINRIFVNNGPDDQTNKPDLIIKSVAHSITTRIMY